ncbi:hypothetical protein FQR65_LT17022 [Abscondita terminalis]|nr:hypothetical protein FQR65_LT17022 [Abscondita terminalis]
MKILASNNIENNEEVQSHIYNGIMKHFNQIINGLTLEEFAKLCFSSKPTILKFCKKIGLTGYSELKYKLKAAIENNDSLHPELSAGTSEFIGNSIYNYFVSKGLKVQSIPTTDITSNPLDYFDVNDDIVLFSFGRSGNSPESVATYNLVNSLNKNTKNIVITTNSNGLLALESKDDPEKNLLFCLPDEMNDKSFAMTSSYTGMLLAAFLILDIKNLDINIKYVNKNSLNVRGKIEEFYKNIEKLSNENIDRIVFLGASYLKGFSQESHLKVLELTAGKMDSYYNSPLGFRHGPKSVLNEKTLVILFMSNNEYSRKYDKDLLKEIYLEKNIKKLVAIDCIDDKDVIENSDQLFNFNIKNEVPIFDGLNYIIFSQLFAFYKSRNFGLSPDNPWPSGMEEISRKVLYAKTKRSCFSKLGKGLQNLGKALIFPIAVLPFAALLNRFGTLAMDLNPIEEGGLVFDNIALMFALGTAFGLSKDQRGEVALVGAVLYIALTLFLGEGGLTDLIYKDLKTPGRESGNDIDSSIKLKEINNKKADKYDVIAENILTIVGKDNIVQVGNCSTRIRLIVKDNKVGSDELFRKAGASGMVRVGTEGLQIIIGTDVEHVADSINSIMSSKNYLKPEIKEDK